MSSERFAYVWSYEIEPSRRHAFLEAYRPGGAWSQLFSRDPSYIETLLLRDFEDESRFVTVDFWRSKADRDAFRERFSREFDDLDRMCETFTRDERFLGDFVEVAESFN